MEYSISDYPMKPVHWLEWYLIKPWSNELSLLTLITVEGGHKESVEWTHNQQINCLVEGDSVPLTSMDRSVCDATVTRHLLSYIINHLEFEIVNRVSWI